MEIAITIKEDIGLDSPTSPIFGRCPYFLFINPKTLEFTIEENSAKNEPGGAGIKAAQKMLERKVTAVISGDVGPKASSVLMAEGIAVYQHQGKTARDSLEGFTSNQLTNLFSSTTQAHTELE